jgi:recombination protein RecA
MKSQKSQRGNFERKGRGFRNIVGKSLALQFDALISGKVKITYPLLTQLLDKTKKYSLETSYQRLAGLHLQHYFFDQIDSIEKSAAQVYDFIVPVNHSFTSNGFISHNTTVSLDFIANAQKMGKLCAYVDAEHALSLTWAKQLGVDPEKMEWIRPDNAEQSFDIMEKLVSSGAYGVVVLDSVAALAPKAELEGTMDEDGVGNRMGLVGKIMSVGLRKLTAIAFKTNTALLFINQVRDRLGNMYGDPENTPGGRALKFYASIRLRVSKLTGKDKVYKDDRDYNIGHRTRVSVKKNKCAPNNGSTAEFDLYYASGIDRIGDILQLAAQKEVGLVESSTKGFHYKDKFYNKEDMRQLLIADPILQESFVATIMEKLKWIPLMNVDKEVKEEQ